MTENDVTASDEEDDVAAFTSYASLAAVIRYARDLIENGYVDEAFGELDRVVHYLNQPRGLSAADEPCSEGVTPNPPEVS